MIGGKYIVVKSESLDSLQAECSEKLDQGYVPLGGLVVSGTWYLQSFEILPEGAFMPQAEDFDHYAGSFDGQVN